MSETHIAVADILMDIEYAMRELDEWHSRKPSPDALASTQPFAVDTLTFTQWLQFIFIPRMYELAENRRPLPGNCEIAPMAEEYFRPQSINAEILIIQLQRIDRLLGAE